MRYFISLFDIFTYSIGFTTLLLAGLLYRKSRDKVNRDFFYITLGFFIANLSYIGDTLSVVFMIPDFFSQHGYFAYIFEIIFCLGALFVIYYAPLFIYRVSGGQLSKIAQVGLLGSVFLCIITDMVTVTYKNTTNPNVWVSLSRYYINWYFIVYTLYFLAIIIRRYSRIQYPDVKQQLKSLFIICTFAIPAELISNQGHVFLEQHQIPQYFFSSSVFYLLWSLVNIRFFIGRLMITNHPKNIEARDLFYQTYAISEREREIIDLVVRGLSNQEIAAKLYITLGTVKTHLHRIFFKTGVKSRMELLHKLNLPQNGPPASKEV